MRYAKAFVAAGLAFTGSLGTALLDSTVTPAEWCTVAGATLAALALVWGIPNKPAA